MLRRRLRQPWWTKPVAFGAVLVALIRSEAVVRIIWRNLAMPTAHRYLRQWLDKQFPRRKRSRRRETSGRSAL